MNHSLSVVHYPDTPDDFLLELQKSQLLTHEQFAQIEADLRDQPEEAQAIADLMIARGWLTSYQAEQIFFGKSELLRWGQYRVLDCVASGGMSEVFKAEHVLMKRIVAIKVLAKSDLGEDPQREIQFAARLQHPNVVTAFDAGIDHDRTYLVMEFVDGMNLQSLLQKAGPLPVGLACDFVRQAALALQYAHAQDLVHRDVKPANFMVTVRSTYRDCESATIAEMIDLMHWPLPFGVAPMIKLLDLGIAQLSSVKSDHETLMGTPDYLAPEIAEDRNAADVRSDLYSLGCTFFQLLTGEIPFPSESWPETVLRHRFDPVPPMEQYRFDVPKPIEAILLRLLAKSPTDRYDTATDLIRALDQCLTRQSVPETVSSDDLMPVSEMELSETDYPAQSEPTATERSSWKSVPLLLALALGSVLVGHEAWIRWGRSVRPKKPSTAEPPRTSAPVVAPVVVPPTPFLLISQDASFSDLGEAIDKAQNGDVLTILTTDPIHLPPLVIRDKDLTIRAAFGGQARLIFDAVDASNPWKPMLSTNRTLTLSNLDIRYPATSTNAALSAPLLQSSGPALHLDNCRIVAKDHVSPITCRNVSNLTLQHCELHAKSNAVSLEVSGVSTCNVSLLGCDAIVQSETGALLSLWSAEASYAARSLEIALEKNVITTGRVLAFTSPSTSSSIHVNARDNQLNYGQSLLSFSGVASTFPWQKILHWKGESNRHPAGAVGARLEGQALPDSLSHLRR